MPSPVSAKDFDAVLFDLDGVLTTTRSVHAAAWKHTFDEFLRTWRADGHRLRGSLFLGPEAYVLPFLIHTSPAVARSLLMHRVRMLPAARRRASEVGCAGALFPWRTINGEEASAYYAAGTAQYHIDADIAYAVDQYVRVTGDTDLLFRHGAELLVETARMWADLGFFSERRDGRFVIHKVTGPDEYTTLVDNNLFTNLMAAENLRMAADSVDRVRVESPPDFRRLVDRTGLRDDEVFDYYDPLTTGDSLPRQDHRCRFPANTGPTTGMLETCDHLGWRTSLA